LFTALLGLMVQVSPAQQPNTQVSLDTSETLFTVLTAINTCGYDTELDTSDPLRSQIRAEVAKNIQASEELKNSVGVINILLAIRRSPTDTTGLWRKCCSTPRSI